MQMLLQNWRYSHIHLTFSEPLNNKMKNDEQYNADSHKPFLCCSFSIMWPADELQNIVLNINIMRILDKNGHSF